ncbi:hypothetical protein, partial [Pilimelia columellifera]|uniref:hypothetical protein n=1 Tax=Pilimelia columellifera TaxID=706574 RepID=UPI0031D054D0
ANFVVFIYEGGDGANEPWSVDSYLLTDTDLPQVWRWLRRNLPVDSCWSLGVVVDPAYPTPESKVKVDWILGADVLNAHPHHRSPSDQTVAEEMLARRNGLTLP